MLKPESFDICKNTTVLMIVILGQLEVDTEVLSTGMETTKSNGCKEVLGNNRDTNSMLAII